MPTILRTVDTTTGDVTLREFGSAPEARRVLARELGQVLQWERDELDWITTIGETEYRVEADPPSE